MNPKKTMEDLGHYLLHRDYEKLMGLLNEVNKLCTLFITISVTLLSDPFLAPICVWLLLILCCYKKPAHRKGSIHTYVSPLSCHFKCCC